MASAQLTTSPWLARGCDIGHLDNVSNNVMLGAINAYTKEPGTLSQLTGEYDDSPKVVRAYKNAGIQSVIIGDENYGEGSSH